MTSVDNSAESTAPVLREAIVVIQAELDDDGTVWHIGLAPCPHDTFHFLVAEHLPEEGSDEPWSEDFPAALLAQCVVWCQDGEDFTTRWTPSPATVARVWEAELPADVWVELIEQAQILSAPEGFEWAQARLRGSPRFALEVTTAAAYNLPYSAFMTWSEKDRAIAMAHYLETKDRCPGCGVPSRLMNDIDGALVDLEACEHCMQRDLAIQSVPEDKRHAIHPRIVPVRGK